MVTRGLSGKVQELRPSDYTNSDALPIPVSYRRLVRALLPDLSAYFKCRKSCKEDWPVESR